MLIVVQGDGAIAIDGGRVSVFELAAKVDPKHNNYHNGGKNNQEDYQRIHHVLPSCSRSKVSF